MKIFSKIFQQKYLYFYGHLLVLFLYFDPSLKISFAKKFREESENFPSSLFPPRFQSPIARKNTFLSKIFLDGQPLGFPVLVLVCHLLGLPDTHHQLAHLVAQPNVGDKLI